MTQQFEKILVPVDFAEHSAEAVRRAADLAQHYSASLTLVYVYEPADYALPEGYVLYTPEQIGRMTQEFEQRLAATQREVQSVGVGRVTTKLLTGSAATEIVDFARDGGFDLIVMGTHGRKGLTHFLMGSVAERVVRLAPCPVMTVKASKSAASSSSST